MPGSPPQQIDDLMEQASSALARTDYFEAESLALRGLLLARRAQDFERMARICMPLQEARRQRAMLAFDAAKAVRVVTAMPADEEPIKPGCYLLRPMLVAADGRRLRERALEERVPVAVLCAEPLTQMRLLPIAALGQVVVRTKVRPPSRLDAPSKQWFIETMEALGDDAIDEIDPVLSPERRVDALLDRLDAVPDHEKLHQRLEEACRAAAHQQALEHAARAASPRRAQRVEL